MLPKNCKSSTWMLQLWVKNPWNENESGFLPMKEFLKLTAKSISQVRKVNW